VESDVLVTVPHVECDFWRNVDRVKCRLPAATFHVSEHGDFIARCAKHHPKFTIDTLGEKIAITREVYIASRVHES
jgi:hypothetical protein